MPGWFNYYVRIFHICAVVAKAGLQRLRVLPSTAFLLRFVLFCWVCGGCRGMFCFVLWGVVFGVIGSCVWCHGKFWRMLWEICPILWDVWRAVVELALVAVGGVSCLVKKMCRYVEKRVCWRMWHEEVCSFCRSWVVGGFWVRFGVFRNFYPCNNGFYPSA